MDIINYVEVDSLEEHIINRKIQEALLDSDTSEWALNYDKKNLGKNLAIAFGLPVDEWEQYKDLDDIENMTGTPGGSGNAFVILGRVSLSLANRFYDKILPHATTFVGTWSSLERQLHTGASTLLKARIQTHGSHGTVGFRTKIDGNSKDTGLQSPDFNSAHVEFKIVNKYNDLTIYRNNNSCENGYQYTVWYI